MPDFPSHLVVKQPVLRKSPLSSVVCQMTFPEILGFDPSAVRPLQVALAADYPVVSREEGMRVNIVDSSVAPTGEVRQIFSFRDNEDHWAVTLSSDSLALETQRYEDFGDFAQRWHKVCAEVTRAMEITQQNRLGLRYINQIPLDEGFDLHSVLRTELVSLVGGGPDQTQELVRSFQEAVFKQDDGFVAFRHGLVDAEGTKNYVLDFDYFSEERGPLDLESQDHTLINFNHGIFNLFKWSVDDATFDAFEPEERKDA